MNELLLDFIRCVHENKIIKVLLQSKGVVTDFSGVKISLAICTDN